MKSRVGMWLALPLVVCLVAGVTASISADVGTEEKGEKRLEIGSLEGLGGPFQDGAMGTFGNQNCGGAPRDW